MSWLWQNFEKGTSTPLNQSFSPEVPLGAQFWIFGDSRMEGARYPPMCIITAFLINGETEVD